MKGFNDLEFKPHPVCCGVQGRMDFDNGFGVSVVRTNTSYGGSKGLYELAVFEGGRICFSTPVTNDVVRSCTEEEITQLMKQVQELPL